MGTTPQTSVRLASVEKPTVLDFALRMTLQILENAMSRRMFGNSARQP